MRNLLQKLPRHAQGPVAALVRTIFAQPDLEAARRQLDQVCATLQRRFPQVVSMLQEAAEEVLTYMHFPSEHWRQIHSTNPLERLNRELARRFDVVGIFPNPQAVLRLLGAVLEEIHEDWMVSRRYFSSMIDAEAVAADGACSDAPRSAGGLSAVDYEPTRRSAAKVHHTPGRDPHLSPPLVPLPSQKLPHFLLQHPLDQPLHLPPKPDVERLPGGD